MCQELCWALSMLLLSTFRLGEDHRPIWCIFGICKHLGCEEVKCQYVANRQEKQDWDEALSLNTRRSPPTLSLLRFHQGERPVPQTSSSPRPTSLLCTRPHSLGCLRAASVSLRGHPQSLTAWGAALGRACAPLTCQVTSWAPSRYLVLPLRLLASQNLSSSSAKRT